MTRRGITGIVVLLCGLATSARSCRLLVREIAFAQDGISYVGGTRGYRHLTGEFVTHLIRRAKDENLAYLARGELEVLPMGRGYAWLDTGTHETLLEASAFIETIERRQGLKIACPEEIAYRMGYIDAAQLRELAKKLDKSGYGEYLRRVISDRVFD